MYVKASQDVGAAVRDPQYSHAGSIGPWPGARGALKLASPACTRTLRPSALRVAVIRQEPLQPIEKTTPWPSVALALTWRP